MPFCIQVSMEKLEKIKISCTSRLTLGLMVKFLAVLNQAPYYKVGFEANFAPGFYVQGINELAENVGDQNFNFLIAIQSRTSN